MSVPGIIDDVGAPHQQTREEAREGRARLERGRQLLVAPIELDQVAVHVGERVVVEAAHEAIADGPFLKVSNSLSMSLGYSVSSMDLRRRDGRQRRGVLI